jgi:hypothetical protein
MDTTVPPASPVCREVRDRRGRVYRVGESDVDLMGRARIWMVVLPWVGMTGVSGAAYAWIAAQAALRDTPGGGGELFRAACLWLSAQATVAFPAGRARESGRLSARRAVVSGAAGVLLVCAAVAVVPDPGAARVALAVLGGAGAGLVQATCWSVPGTWYPERRGGPTALVVGGLAHGAVPVLLLAGPGAGDPRVLGASGAGMCLAVAAAGWFLRCPPRNWWPPHHDPLTAARRTREKNPPAVRHHTPGQAARTPVLWVLWLCLLGAAGVTVLGVCLPAPAGRGPAFGGAAPDATAWAVVAGGAAVGAVGVLSDRFGRRAVLGAACALLGLARFGAAVAGPGDGVPLLLGCAAAAGLAGVAVLALIGALAADHFGENHSASVLGLLAWAWLLPPALLTGTAAAVGRVPDLHGTLLPAGCTALACTVPALFLKAPGRPSARRIVPNPHPLGEEMA